MNMKTMELPKKVKQGLRAFNKRSYYQAHEYFEDAWRETPGSDREFYRVLLHISGGFFRLTQGKPQAAIKFFQHALKWLDNLKPNFQGFDLTNIKQVLNLMIFEIKNHAFPEIILEQHRSSIFANIEEDSE